jgi:PAS domain S-box-containing protein
MANGTVARGSLVEPQLYLDAQPGNSRNETRYSNDTFTTEIEIYDGFYRAVVQKLLKAPHFFVFLLNTANQLMECHFAVVAGQHIPADQIPAYTPSGFTTQLMSSKHPITTTIRDGSFPIDGWNMYLKSLPAEARNIKSFLFSPVINDEKPIGLLSVAYDEVDAFGDEFIPLISLFANMIATGHLNQQLVDELREQSAELQSLYNASSTLFRSRDILELGQQITQAVIREFNHVDCGLILKYEGYSQLVRVARSGQLAQNPTNQLYLDGPGLVPEAIRSGKTVYAPNVKHSPIYVENDPLTQSELVIPLIGTNGVIGVFDLQSTRPDGFSERNQRILTAFAERAAGAIEIVLLYESLDRYAAELEFRVAQRMTEVLSAKEKVEAILNSASDLIIVLSEKGKIQQVNPAFTTVMGYDSDAVFGHPIEGLFEASEINLQSVFQTVIETQTAQRCELKTIRDDQTVLEVDAVFSPLSRADSARPLLICSLRDITAQKRLADGLREALERERELGEMQARFSSTVSHEFRTPLAVIQTSIDILDTNYSRMTPAKVSQHLGKIGDQVQRLTHLMDDVLIIAKNDAVGMPFNPAPVNLDTFSKNIVDDVAQQMRANDRVRYSCQGDCTEVRADKDLIHHILINLVTNAIKYSRANDRVHVQLKCHQSQATFIVQDEGIGIPLNAQERIFDDFYRANNVGTIHGTGLGLSIVKRAVEAHQGTISLHSLEGQGTTFTVTIPIAQRVDTSCPEF